MRDNAGQKYLSGLGVGWPGVSCSGPTWLSARLRMSSHSHSVICSVSPHSAFIPIPPLPLVMVSICVSSELVSVTVPGGWLPLTGLS